MDDNKTTTEKLKQGTFYDLNTSPANILLNTADLLVSLNIKRTTLYEWIQKKHLPPPFEKCGKENHWTVGQIREWRAARALGKLFKNPCSQAELNKIVPFGFSLQRQKMVFFFAIKIV